MPSITKTNRFPTLLNSGRLIFQASPGGLSGQPFPEFTGSENPPSPVETIDKNIQIPASTTESVSAETLSKNHAEIISKGGKTTEAAANNLNILARITV